MTPPHIEEIARALEDLDAAMKAIGGCSDGYCIIRKPVGMHTNGGCRCSSDRYRMQRYAAHHNRFADAIRALASESEG